MRARALVDALQSRDLLLEPFDRAAAGISEAYLGTEHVVE